MKYPIAIEPGTKNQAWGVVVPDLPGCFSAADSGLDEAIDQAKEAIELWIEMALDEGQVIPKPSSLRDLQKKKEYKGWAWAIVEIDPALLSDEIERINIMHTKNRLRECKKPPEGGFSLGHLKITLPKESVHDLTLP
jgi:predicted RNase H-like HicB family nuclease